MLPETRVLSIDFEYIKMILLWMAVLYAVIFLTDTHVYIMSGVSQRRISQAE